MNKSDIEEHTFKCLQIVKSEQVIKVYSVINGEDISKTVAKYLLLGDFKDHFDEISFYSSVLPRLVKSYHAFANYLMIEHAVDKKKRAI